MQYGVSVVVLTKNTSFSTLFQADLTKIGILYCSIPVGSNIKNYQNILVKQQISKMYYHHPRKIVFIFSLLSQQASAKMPADIGKHVKDSLCSSLSVLWIVRKHCS